MRKAEVPESSNFASAADLAFVDAMWADPQEASGVQTNPRGAGLVLFGPDVTAQFLEENRLELVVRSHQLPDTLGGYKSHHNGSLITVFSASNYCGLCDNEGAVLLCKPDGSCEAVPHFAPGFQQIAQLQIEAPDSLAEETPAAIRRGNSEKRKSDADILQKLAQEAAVRDTPARTEKLEKEVLWRAARMIVEKKQALYEYWQDCDVKSRGFVSFDAWSEGMANVLGNGLPWPTIGKVLRVGDAYTEEVDYRSFINRFRVTITESNSGRARWLEEMLGRFYGRLLTLKGDAGSLSELEGFLGHGENKVSKEGACEVFQWVLGNTLTESQANAMLRTLSAHAEADPAADGQSMDVWGFLSRLDVCYQHHSSVSQGVPMGAQAEGSPEKEPVGPRPLSPPSPWVRSVLTHVGRLLWMTDAAGSPKAGGHRMLQVFQRYDDNGDGLLERAEFAKAVRHLLKEHENQLPASIHEETATSERIDELIQHVDVSGDGIVNYLEFMHAFQPVDRTPGRGLRMDLMEQICSTIWANKPSLLRTLQVCEETLESSRSGDFTGRIHRDNLKRTLRSLNASLGGSRGAPLTNDQIDILVDHAECDADGRLNYQKFLDAVQIVDTDPPPEEDSVSRVAAGAGAGPAPRGSNASTGSADSNAAPRRPLSAGSPMRPPPRSGSPQGSRGSGGPPLGGGRIASTTSPTRNSPSPTRRPGSPLVRR
jgi:protein phosphatase